MTTDAILIRQCAACGGRDLAPLLTASDLRTAAPGTYAYALCLQCRLVQISPAPSSAQLAAAYPDWLWQDELARGRSAPSRVKHALAQLAKHGKTTGDMLDVGCGPGTLLVGARAAGWRALGIESSGEQVRYCRSRDLEAEFVPDFSAYADTRSYDAVVFNHVLEHVPAPRAYVHKALTLLKPDGLLLVAVPNVDSLSRLVFGKYWMHLDAPRHLFQFSPRTLSDIIQREGGKVVDVVMGDREDNATGVRDSLRRWLMYGIAGRPVRATRATENSAPNNAADLQRPAIGRRLYRAYGQAIAALSESVHRADTIVTIAQRA